jgi:hypothetical protein
MIENPRFTGIVGADFDDHLMLMATGLWNFYLEAA